MCVCVPVLSNLMEITFPSPRPLPHPLSISHGIAFSEDIKEWQKCHSFRRLDIIYSDWTVGSDCQNKPSERQEMKSLVYLLKFQWRRGKNTWMWEGQFSCFLSLCLGSLASFWLVKHMDMFSETYPRGRREGGGENEVHVLKADYMLK